MFGDDSDDYSSFRSKEYVPQWQVKDRIERAQAFIKANPSWYCYEAKSKARKDIDAAYEEIAKMQKSCCHSWKVETLFQLPRKICSDCGLEDRSYDPLKRG